MEKGGFGGAKSLIFHCFFNRIELLALFEKKQNFRSNMVPKMLAKSMTNLTFGVRGSDFCDAGKVLEEFDF